ncbi:hypothetical protein Tco_0950968 [Tanacetum coccineum]|uniref:Reverse transcriptase domain-containing protein n=1 Tax=Tanacetum coccineum TaxID=301880 RepID=A0ABQ5DVJ9_9ASTR
MKKVIVELPLLTTPRKEETMYVYLAAAEEGMSAILADFLSEAPVGILQEAFFRVPARVQNKDDVEKWTLLRIEHQTEWVPALAWFSSAPVANYVIMEIHMGSCGMHIRASSRPGAKTSKNLKDINHGSMPILSMRNGYLRSAAPVPRKGLDENEDELSFNMDLLQERREVAAIKEAKYKTNMEQYCNQKVRLTSFKPDGYVFWRNEASRVEDQGKLGPKWEGPYQVTEAYQNGFYKLQTMRGKEVPRTWHAINLRKCYL